MFDIFFESGDPFPYDEENDFLWLPGQSVFGDFAESFIAPLGWWSRPEYERQWIEGARRLVSGLRESAFVLEPGRLWWTAWLDGDHVVIQQRLLVAPEMAAARAARPAAVPYDAVGIRNSEGTDGHPVSEWKVSLDDLRDFLARRESPVAPHSPSS